MKNMFSSTFLSSSDFLPSPAFFRFLPSSSLLLSVIVQPPATDDRMRRKKTRKNRKESRRLRNLKYQKKQNTLRGLGHVQAKYPLPFTFPAQKVDETNQTKEKSQKHPPHPCRETPLTPGPLKSFACCVCGVWKEREEPNNDDDALGIRSPQFEDACKW
jgi:hypothetical protein